MIDGLTFILVVVTGALPFYLFAYLALVKHHLGWIAGYRPPVEQQKTTSNMTKRIGWWCFTVASFILITAIIAFFA